MKEKKIICKIGVFLIGCMLIYTVIQVISTLQIAKAEEESLLYMMGILVKEEYDMVDVTDLIKGVQTEVYYEKGMEYLKKYGYENVIFDRTRQRVKSAILQEIAGFCVFVLLICVTLVNLYKLMLRKSEESLDVVREELDQFAKGNYSLERLQEQEGNIGKIYNYLDDIGRQIELNNRRFTSEKEETKALVTDISHQLKTPLASLQMCFSIMEDKNITAQEREEFFERAKEQTDRLKSLVAALVNISRMENGMIHIAEEQADLKETLIEAINAVYVKAMEKKITIELEECDSIYLKHDKKWTKEALVNVLDNSIKYSGGTTVIKTSIQKRNSYVRIEISDQGVGIEKEELNYIFKRFYRGKSEVVKRSDGSGVGLYLTRKILEEQGGTIIAKQNKNGIGTTFVIQILYETKSLTKL